VLSDQATKSLEVHPPLMKPHGGDAPQSAAFTMDAWFRTDVRNHFGVRSIRTDLARHMPSVFNSLKDPEREDRLALRGWPAADVVVAENMAFEISSRQ
jgi:hypothetical protein